MVIIVVMVRNTKLKKTNSKISNLIKIVFVVLSLLLIYPVLASATTYYVAKSGNDGYPGTYTQPWLTITKAANTMIAGDTVFVRAGIYNERLIPKNSGSAGKYITYAVYPDNYVTIKGTGLLPVAGGYDGLVDISKNYINVTGFNFVDVPQVGIHINNANYIIARNNTFITNVEASAFKVGWGHASNIIIENNVIDRTTIKGVWAEMISVSTTDGVIVRNNHIIRNTVGEGIDLKDNTSNGKIYNNIVENTSAVGIYIDARGIMRNIEIYNNMVHTPGEAGIVLNAEKVTYGGATIQNASVYNNIVYGSASGIRISPFSIYMSSGNVGYVKDINIINNDFYNNELNDIGCDGYGHIVTQNVILRNNIFNKNSIRVCSGISSAEHNLFDSISTAYGSNYIIGDPKFIDPTHADFNLQSTSPAIDKGSSIGAPSVDFHWNARPRGAGYDEGAYEYSSTLTPTLTPIAYWKFDENTGTTAKDSSGNGMTGTITGATWTTGKIGSALKFNGANSYVSVPSFNETFKQVTVIAWIKVNNYSDYRKILDFGLDGLSGRRFTLQASSTGLDFDIDGGGRGEADYLTSDTTNWTHVAGTWTEGQNVKIYINGQLKATDTTGILNSDLVVNSGDAHIIGRRISAANYFNGIIDEVKIYNKALNASEIAAAYQGSTP